MPMTEHGFQKLTYAELLEQQINRAKDLFGQDIDTSEKSVLGKYIRLNVSDFAQLEESLEEIYQARYIDTAYGISLDRLTPFAGITRNGAVRAVLLVTLKNNGETDASISMNTKIVNTDGILYHTLTAVTVPAGGDVSVLAECDTAGEIGNRVSKMQFYNTQIPNVTISYSSLYVLRVTGQDTETDEALRKRWKKALSGSGCGTADAVIGAVSRIDSVQDCILYENETDAVKTIGEVENGTLGPHSFLVIVKGGEGAKSEIAAAIFSKKPLGIATEVGTGWKPVSESVKDIAGNSHTIRFVYASTVGIRVHVTISKENEPDFQPDEAKEVFAKVLESFLDDYRIGQPVYASTLYAPLVQSGMVYCIDKIEVEAVVGEIALGADTKVIMGVDEYAVLESVEIVYTEGSNGE